MSRLLAGFARPVGAKETPVWRKHEQERIRKGPRKKMPASRNGPKRRQRKSKIGRAKRAAAAATSKRTLAEADSLRRLLAITEAFRNLRDPRVNRRRRHLLIDIIVTAVCAVIAGALDWKGIARWGRLHEAWLARFLELPNGIPSRDTFRRVLSRIDPVEFQKCFLDWTSSLVGCQNGRLLNIDGKTLRRSGRRKEDSPLHIVSVWANEQHMALGQTTVEAKSNEITAIPKLLDLLDLQGALITIDAMGCQTAIARKIIDGQGEYCLAVKGNQEHLEQDIAGHFDRCIASEFAKTKHRYYQTQEFGHGRRDTREYYLTAVPATLRKAAAWKGLSAVGMAVSSREIKGKEEVEIRYYIVSFGFTEIKRFASAVRGHWGIENSLHWIMDVTFREDDCRIQNKIGASNFSWLRRFAISLLKNEPTLKDSIKGKREEAMWNVDYLLAVLLAARPNT